MSKLPHIGSSIFSVMSQLATQHQAINLAQGFPDFGVDSRLKEIAAQCALEEIHQYQPMAGYTPLLEKIAELTAFSYGRKVNPATEILVTAGATQGLFASIQALVDAEDEVIILDPAYDSYDTPVLLCKALPVHVKMQNDFSPDWQAIADALNGKTKMIIINNPHNPSGRIWSEDDFTKLEKLLERYPNVVVLSDEVYEYITFERKHISVNQRPELQDRSIVVSSFGKSFHITGWKIGYLIAPESMMKEIKKVHQFLVFSVNSIAQHAICAYIDHDKVSALGAFYQEKRDYFKQLLIDSRFTLLPCEGTYFQTVSYENISDETDILFAKRLLTDFGVAAIPLSHFYATSTNLRCLRFCFAKENETLEKAAAILRRL